MSRLRFAYHRLVPERFRNPLGRVRRDALDRLLRARSDEPLPPPALLTSIQPTPWIADYLRTGSEWARSILGALERAGAGPDSPMRVLDFRCGPARILRHLRGTSWRLHGCDSDARAIAWSKESFPDLGFVRSDREPPLPFESSSFDFVIAVSVLPHVSSKERDLWRAEIARVVKPGGLLVVSTLGPSFAGSFAGEDVDASRKSFRESGSFEAGSRPRTAGPFAFHSARGVASSFAPEFEVLEWVERGLDGTQDLSVLRVRPDPRPR